MVKLPGRLFWPWRGWAVLAFFICQTHSGLVGLSLPVLSLGGLLALLAGEFEHDRRQLNALEWAGLAFLAAFLLAAYWGVNPARSLALTGAAWPTIVLYLLLRDQRPGWAHAGKPVVGGQRPGLDQPAHWTFPVLLLGSAILISVQSLQILAAVWQQPRAEPAQWIHHAASPWLVVPNDWSWVMVSLSLLTPLAARAGQQSSAGLERWLSTAWYGLVLLAFLMALLLRSRGALLCAVVAASALFYMKMRWSGLLRSGLTRRWSSVVRSGSRWLLIAAVLLVLVGFWDAHQDYALLTKLSRLNDTRFALWWAAWQIFLDHPWHGVGPHNFVAVYPQYLPGPESALPIDPRLTPWPHQLFLEILAAQGILGLTPGLLILFFYLRTFIKLPPLFAIKAPLMAASLAFLVTALVEASLLRLWTWLALALIFAAITSAEHHAKLSQAAPAED